MWASVSSTGGPFWLSFGDTPHRESNKRQASGRATDLGKREMRDKLQAAKQRAGVGFVLVLIQNRIRKDHKRRPPQRRLKKMLTKTAIVAATVPSAAAG